MRKKTEGSFLLRSSLLPAAILRTPRHHHHHLSTRAYHSLCPRRSGRCWSYCCYHSLDEAFKEGEEEQLATSHTASARDDAARRILISHQHDSCSDFPFFSAADHRGLRGQARVRWQPFQGEEREQQQQRGAYSVRQCSLIPSLAQYIRLPAPLKPYALRFAFDAGTVASKNGVLFTNFPPEGKEFKRDQFYQHK